MQSLDPADQQAYMARVFRNMIAASPSCKDPSCGSAGHKHGAPTMPGGGGTSGTAGGTGSGTAGGTDAPMPPGQMSMYHPGLGLADVMGAEEHARMEVGQGIRVAADMMKVQS